ncbi:MAG: DUF4838 domain-containing protein [Planctomycetota bacterium]|nr:DUF4838 domain-containing protein [Planctomycetota bacterium]
MSQNPHFLTRGVVLITRDLETLDWPARAKSAGLTTIATHVRPQEIVDFLATDSGQQFLEQCSELGLHVEHELHAMSELLPRDLFDRNPEMFRMDEDGNRVREDNLCVNSKEALEVIAERTAHFTRLLPSTTGRYFYWGDDAKSWCRCAKCRHLSDSDQALLTEHAILRAVQTVDPRGTLAHIVYHKTLQPPTHVKPDPGIFLEFAPIQRRYDRPLADRAAQNQPTDVTHGEHLDCLDANLAVFGAETAQVLEYWMDVSRFSGWNREQVKRLQWNPEVFLADVELYASRGIRHVTQFAVWLDGWYVERFGEAPIDEYGVGLLQFDQSVRH